MPVISALYVCVLVVACICLHPYTCFNRMCVRMYIYIVAIIMYQKDQTKNVFYIRYIGVMAVDFCWVFFVCCKYKLQLVVVCRCLHIILGFCVLLDYSEYDNCFFLCCGGFLCVPVLIRKVGFEH